MEFISVTEFHFQKLLDGLNHVYYSKNESLTYNSKTSFKQHGTMTFNGYIQNMFWKQKSKYSDIFFKQ